MKTLTLLTFLGFVLHDTTAAIHSLKYFYAASSDVPEFPEFVTVGYVDDVHMFNYDSNTRRAEPKQAWMNKVTEERADYWQSQTENLQGSHQTFKVNIETLKQRFNQTGGVHIWQLMYGCEWDDETGAVKGFFQYGYDEEDFIALDLETETWIAPQQQAVITKHKWDNNRGWTLGKKHYLTKECPEWVQKYVKLGSSSLMRTDLPSVSLLQKTSTSPITCHATGFYPNSAVLFWRKDGQELHEDVDHGETLPNPDGSFQTSVDLKRPSEPSADWGRYECVFQLAGVDEDQVTKLDKEAIMSNEGSCSESPPAMVIGIIAAVVVLAVALIAVILFMLKKRNAKRPPSPVSDPVVEHEKCFQLQALKRQKRRPEHSLRIHPADNKLKSRPK